MGAADGETGKGWMQRLARRWGVKSSRVLVILLVFACTGFSVMFLKRPLVQWASGGEVDPPWLFTVAYYILVLPLYNLLLLGYGALFGQFKFFWSFEKRFFAKLLDRGRKP